MTHTATLFGFGSFFHADPHLANDVDLLILHRATEGGSIDFAIHCKRMLQTSLPKAHVVMLSDAEERELDFKRRSNAVHLTDIDSNSAYEQIATFSRRISKREFDYSH